MAIYAPSLDEIQKALSGEGVQEWTPELWDASKSAAEGQSYSSSNEGFYTRAGSRVDVWGTLGMASLGTLTTTDGALIGNLPYAINTAKSGTYKSVCIGVHFSINLASAHSLSGYFGADSIILRVNDATVGQTNLLISEVSLDGHISFSGWYLTDDTP